MRSAARHIPWCTRSLQPAWCLAVAASGWFPYSQVWGQPARCVAVAAPGCWGLNSQVWVLPGGLAKGVSDMHQGPSSHAGLCKLPLHSRCALSQALGCNENQAAASKKPRAQGGWPTLGREALKSPCQRPTPLRRAVDNSTQHQTGLAAPTLLHPLNPKSLTLSLPRARTASDQHGHVEGLHEAHSLGMALDAQVEAPQPVPCQ